MTSSLVGSEMCIRDRTRRALGWGMQLGAQVLACRRRSSSSAAWSAAHSAVSYTHLTLPTICSV
eukprot:8118229-Prorocentrum_lima.AAC.1